MFTPWNLFSVPLGLFSIQLGRSLFHRGGISRSEPTAGGIPPGSSSPSPCHITLLLIRLRIGKDSIEFDFREAGKTKKLATCKHAQNLVKNIATTHVVMMDGGGNYEIRETRENGNANCI